MSKQLEELLFTIRQHPAFQDLLKGVEAPEPAQFRPSKGAAQEQFADFVYRSGRGAQHALWRDFLTGPPAREGI